MSPWEYMPRADEILRKHGATVTQERDWLIAEWHAESLDGTRVVRIIVDCAGGPVVEEIELENIWSMTTVAKLASFAKAMTKAAAAALEIEALGRSVT